MKTNRPKQLKDAVEHMRSKVNENLTKIQRINESISLIKRNSKISKDNKDINEKITKYESQSNKFFNENQELIRIQNSIIKYFNRFCKSKAEQRVSENKFSIEEIFDLTIIGEFKIDESHPFFESSEMLNELLEHFTNTEEYEKCSELIELIKKSKTKELENK